MWEYILGAYLILHYFVDTHYFLRLFLQSVIGRYILKKKSFPEPCSIYGICTTNDVDFLLNHMNNARIQREFDFGRMDYGFRTGMIDDFIKRGGGFLICGVSIRYRLSLKIFSPYKVVTTPVWWDEKFLYFDQRVITLSDCIVRAVAFIKLATKINCVVLIEQLFPTVTRPEPSEDLRIWIESQEISRTNMKKQS